MPVKSLLKLATEACVANIRAIDDIGEAPYEIVRPVLLKIENPDQLRIIEEASPQIAGADAEIWRNFIKRDIRNWQSKKVEPRDPQNWYKVYRRLRKEDEKERKEREATLLQALNQQTEQKKDNQMRYIPQVIDPQKKSSRPGPTTFARTANGSVLHFAGGSKTKMTTGKGLLERAKREAREASFYTGKRSALSTPTHLLNGNATHGRIVGPKTTCSHAAPSSAFAARPQAPTTAASESRTVNTGPGPSSNPNVGSLSNPSVPAVYRASPSKRPAASVFMPPKKRRV